MKFFYAMLVWMVIGFILGLGIFLMTKQNGSPWLFIIAMLGFVVAVAKIGCKTH